MTGVLTGTSFLPVHQIRAARMVQNKHGQEMATVVALDGQTWSEVETWERFTEKPVQLIPCEPGTSLLHAWTDGDDPEQWSLGRTPLIGWALCLDGVVRPVTPYGVNDSCTEPEDIGNFVEMPGGQVVSTSSWASRYGYDNADHFFLDVLATRGKGPPEESAS